MQPLKFTLEAQGYMEPEAKQNNKRENRHKKQNMAQDIRRYILWDQYAKLT